jgi:hypothetical protein
MHWLLLIVRFLLRAIPSNPGDGVALAARIDGRTEQQRHRWLGNDGSWSLLTMWWRRDASLRRDRCRAVQSWRTARRASSELRSLRD